MAATDSAGRVTNQRGDDHADPPEQTGRLTEEQLRSVFVPEEPAEDVKVYRLGSDGVMPGPNGGSVTNCRLILCAIDSQTKRFVQVDDIWEHVSRAPDPGGDWAQYYWRDGRQRVRVWTCDTVLTIAGEDLRIMVPQGYRLDLVSDEKQKGAA